MSTNLFKPSPPPLFQCLDCVANAIRRQEELNYFLMVLSNELYYEERDESTAHLNRASLSDLKYVSLLHV